MFVSSRFHAMISIAVIFICFLPAESLAIERLRLPVVHRPRDAFLLGSDGDKLPLSGGISTVGEFYANVSLGTPPQFVTVQLDTGSSDLLIYSDGCKGCGPYKRRFDFSSSSTGSKIPCDADNRNVSCYGQCYQNKFCGFDDQYGDGSGVQGYVGWDVLHASYLSANASFGAIETASADFEPNSVEGIWGLAYRSISSWGGLSGVFQLTSQNGLPSVFSMCLRPDGAYFDIGSAGSVSAYTPVVQEEYYAVQADQLLLGNEPLDVGTSDFGQTIVDSGTTLVYLPHAVYKKLYKAVKKLCDKPGLDLPGVCGTKKSKGIFGGYCVQMSDKERSNFPVLNVKLQGISTPLSIPPSAYLLNQQGYYCLGIEDGGQGTILGDVFMRNKLVAFDAENQRVGFGQCE